MRKIIQRLLVFFIPIVVFLLFTLIYFYNYRLIVDSEIERISQYECIIMGDSQMERVDPNQFSRSTFNFSSTGENFLFTYEKIKRLIKSGDYKFKQILLGVSPVSFAPIHNRSIDTKFIEGRMSLTRYLYFMDLDNEFFRDVEILSKSMLKAIYREPHWGGWTESKNCNPDSTIINMAFRQHFKIVLSENKYSPLQIRYLSKIDSICKVNDISLVLVSIPHHPTYIRKIDDLYFDLLYQSVNSMNYVKYINYLDYEIDPELMSDANHLNSKGGKIFSKNIALEVCDTIERKSYNADLKDDPMGF